MSKIGDRRHDEILKAAAAEFFGRGVEKASMSDIAARAGIGKSTIYEYFPSKGELLAAVCKQLIQRMEQENGEIFSGQVSFREKISQYYASILEILQELCDSPNTMNSVAMLLMTNPHVDDISEYVRHFQNSIAACLKQAILEAQENGEVRRDLNVDAAACYLLALPNPHLFQSLKALNADPVEEIVQLALRGMEQ